MNFMLDINSIDKTQPIDNFSDKLLYGGQMLLIGLATVFAVLITLWIALVLFKVFFHDLPSRPKKVKEVANETAPVNQASETSESEEIIAVIAAAIAMAENECGGNKQFRVVSFKRK
jgi:Na+-transporting methylmalonyl-CoA/oxaloacetate decarboxylase gamma subunit